LRGAEVPEVLAPAERPATGIPRSSPNREGTSRRRGKDQRQGERIIYSGSCNGRSLNINISIGVRCKGKAKGRGWRGAELTGVECPP